ncbi:hypothetical protein TNCV_3176631 [Trichonephila clavipes]|nr:hypothetical protein TNCV_3176631 [Trichonephila clavipes]
MSAVYHIIGDANTYDFQSRVNEAMDAFRTFYSAANGVKWCVYSKDISSKAVPRQGIREPDNWVDVVEDFPPRSPDLTSLKVFSVKIPEAVGVCEPFINIVEP